MSIIQNRVDQFFVRFPSLFSVIERLNAAQIPFAIGGSGCLFLYGNERLPDDVDIYLPDERHDDADKLFGIESYVYASSMEHVRNSNPGGGHAIQLTSDLTLTVAEKSYPIRLSQSVLQKCFSFDYQGQRVTFFPIEDVLLIKALLQRGSDVGKHDVEDIQKFLAIYPIINREYLQSRILELDAGGRVGSIL